MYVVLEYNHLQANGFVVAILLFWSDLLAGGRIIKETRRTGGLIEKNCVRYKKTGTHVHV